MELPSIDIDAVPVLDTAVGLFGSLLAHTGPSVFEVTVTVVLIVYD